VLPKFQYYYIFNKYKVPVIEANNKTLSVDIEINEGINRIIKGIPYFLKNNLIVIWGGEFKLFNNKFVEVEEWKLICSSSLFPFPPSKGSLSSILLLKKYLKIKFF